MRALRKTLVILGSLVVGLGLVVALGGAALQWRPVQQWLATAAARAISGEGATAVLGRVEGMVPFDMRLSELRLADGDGEWLAVTDFSLSFSPLDLLRRRVDIDQFRAGEIAVARLPVTPAAAPPPPQWHPPELPHPPIALRLDTLRIDAVRLAAPVLGEAVALSVGGAASFAGAEISARLALRRIDDAAGQAELAFDLTGQPARLKVAIVVAEPSGVLLARLLGRDDRPALHVELSGDGPLADWRGQLTATGGDLARLDATLGIAADDAYHLSMTGKLMAQPLLPAIGDGLAFDGRFAATTEGQLRIEQLTLETAAATLSATGAYDSVGKTLAAEATLAVPDLAPFSDSAGAPLAGGVQARLTASGPMPRPQLVVVVDGRDLRYAGDGVAQAHADLRLTAEGDVGRAETRYRLQGEGRLEGIRRAAAALPTGLGDTLRWRLAATSDAAGDRVELTELGLTLAGVTLIGNATVRQGGTAADGRAVLAIADLGPLSDLAGRPLAGTGKFDLTARTNPDGSIEGQVSGGLTEAKLGVEALDALLGGAVTLNAAARREADGRVQLAELSLSGSGVSLTGSGAVSAEHRLDGRLSLDLPKLAMLSSVLDIPLAGGLGVKMTATGPLDAPDMRAEITGDGLAAGPRKLDRVRATIVASGGNTGTGRFDGDFRAGHLDGALAGSFALRDDGKSLDMSQLRLTAAGTSIEGKLRTALDTMLTSGAITGRIPDLAPWSTLAGVSMAGQAEFKAVLGTKGGQTADLDLRGSGLKLALAADQAVAVERLTARVQSADLLGKPKGQASVEVGRAALAGGEVAALSLQVGTTKPGQFSFDVKGNGRLRQRFALAAAGDATLQPGGGTLRLSRFSGTLAGETVQLKQPLTVKAHGANLAFADLSLGLGNGQLAGSGALDGQRLALNLKAERLPIGLAAKFAGKSGVSGTLDAEADLSGTRASPQGRLLVTGQSLRFAAGRRDDVPVLALNAEANWRDGRVEAKGRVFGPKDQMIGFAGAIPLELAPQSLAVSLPPRGLLSVKLQGGGELADLQDLLPIGEDRIAGKIAIDVQVGGTIAQPTAAGSLGLRGGRYESMAMGTVLNAIELDLVGDRQHFTLRTFRASDGEQGEVTAEGGVDLAASPGPAVDARVRLQGFRLLRRDEATLAASGAMQLAGPLTALKVKGQLRVDQGELRIPDRLPPRVAELSVVEIRSRSGQPPTAATTEQATTQDGASSVGLEIRIDVPGKVFVRGRGLDGEWRGKLDVTGDIQQPIIVGALETVRGTVSVLDKTFTLSRGTIGFTGGGKIDPTLDILAETNAGDITGTVELHGTALAPTLRIGSRPELPRDEVLARILFGKGLGQITPAQGLRIAAAAASLAGGGPGYLDKVRSTLGLDRFDIGSGSAATTAAGNSAASAGGLGNTTVSAGKYVAEGVYVGVDQGTSTSTSRAKVEIELTPRISIETTVGASGGNAIGLNWKMDY